MENKMFCYQCQETGGGTGCTVQGVCGKKAEVAAAQDLLIYISKGISQVTTRLRKEGKKIDPGINHRITLNLFTTITNANFDEERIYDRIRATLREKAALLSQLKNTGGLSDAATWYSEDAAELAQKS